MNLNLLHNLTMAGGTNGKMRSQINEFRIPYIMKNADTFVWVSFKRAIFPTIIPKVSLKYRRRQRCIANHFDNHFILLIVV